MISFNPFSKLRRAVERAQAEKNIARDEYLSLMQDCLTNRLYEDPPLDTFGAKNFDPATRKRGLDWPSTAHTMIGSMRMSNLRTLVEKIIEDRIPGDLLEAGVWRGGACIFMRAILKAHDECGRRVWVADSFAGLPSPDPLKYPADTGQTFHEYPELAVSLEDVQDNFARYGLLDDQVGFLKGWFKDTLPDAPIEKLALLRVDGDLYESTSDALSNLYNKLSVGGFVIIDDYGVVEACRKATNDFRASHGIADPIQPIDGVGIYWRKSGGRDYPQPEVECLKEFSLSERPAHLAGSFYWQTEECLMVGDVGFLVTCDMGKLMGTDSTERRFVIGKARSMVEDSISLSRRRKIGNIFEIGIFKGGSMVLNDLIFAPRRIVGIEYSVAPNQALASYIEKMGKSEVIKPYYGVDQADRQAMERILASEFPDRDIDMIVDDASHLYEQTRAAFNISFPYLRPGGLYVIEDWAWAHWSGDFWQKENSYFGSKPAMSNLLIELFMLSASRPDLIERIEVVSSVITVTKGAGELPAEDFDLAKHYLLRGKKFEALL